MLLNKLNHYQLGLYGLEKCNLEIAESLKKNKAFITREYINKHIVGIGELKMFKRIDIKIYSSYICDER